MLYRLLIVSELVGAVGLTKDSVADILGASERNNRRDAIGSAMIFHEGQAAVLLEGMRVDVDRLMKRLNADSRHCNLDVVSDRPVIQRRIPDPVRLYALSPDQAEQILDCRPLKALEPVDLERLLSCDSLRVSA